MIRAELRYRKFPQISWIYSPRL